MSDLMHAAAHVLMHNAHAALSSDASCPPRV